MSNKLLVLDDEADIITLYRSILDTMTPAAFEVTYVSTAADAIRALQSAIEQGTPFTGGFFDIQLGGKDSGLDVIRRAQQLDSSILCVIVTGWREKTIEEIHALLGEKAVADWDFIDKPFSRNEILQKAYNIVANRNRRDEERKRHRNLRQRERDMVREMLDDVIICLQGELRDAMKKKQLAEVQTSLQKAFTHSERVTALMQALIDFVEKDTEQSVSG